MSDPVRPENAAAAAMRQLTESLAAIEQSRSAEEIERRRKWRRRQFAKEVAKLSVVAVLVVIGYMVLRRPPVQLWLSDVLSRPVPWYVSALLVVPALFPLFFLPWIALFSLKDPAEKRTAWRYTLLWALVLIFCLYMVWSGRWPPDCAVKDCY